MAAEPILPGEERLSTEEEQEVEEIVASIMGTLKKFLAIPILGHIAEGKISKFLDMIDRGQLGDKHIAEIMRRVILRVRELDQFK